MSLVTYHDGSLRVDDDHDNLPDAAAFELTKEQAEQRGLRLLEL